MPSGLCGRMLLRTGPVAVVLLSLHILAAAASRLEVPNQYPTIQQALAAANEGDVVYVHPGTYYETVRITTNIRLEGAGSDSVTLCSPRTLASHAAATLTIVSVEGVSVSGITVTGVGGGISIRGSDRVELRGVVVEDVAGIGISVVNSSAHIESVRVSRSGETGVAATEGSVVDIVDCVLMQCRLSGIHVSKSEVSVVRTTIGETRRFFGVAGVGLRISNASTASIVGNSIGGNTGHGITATQRSSVTVESNDLFENGGSGIHVSSGVRAVVRDNKIRDMASFGIWVVLDSTASIVGNDIHRASAVGIAVDVDCSVEVKANRVVDTRLVGGRANGIDVGRWCTAHIAGNVLERNSGGITVHTHSSATIVDNHILNSTGFGISLWGQSDGILRGNRIDGVRLDARRHAVGINLDGSGGCLVEGNVVSGSEKLGLIIYNSLRVEVAQNTVNGSAGSGIHVGKSSNVVIKENTVSGSGGIGIDAYDTLDLVIAENQIARSTGHGIYVGGASLAQVTGNDVSGTVLNREWNHASGIKVGDGAAGTVSGNSVRDSAQHGIHLYKAHAVSIVANEIWDNAYFGIDVWGSKDITIEGNRVSGNRRRGISVGNSAGLVVRANMVSDCGEVGIAGHDVTDLIVSGNRVVRAVGHGIYVGGASLAQVTGNDVSGTVLNREWNHASGIKVGDGAAGTVSGNSVRDSAQHGIHLYKAHAVSIVANEIWDNAYFGIDVWESKDITIESNAVSGNGTHGIHVARSMGVSIRANTIRSTVMNIEWYWGSGVKIQEESVAWLVDNHIVENAVCGVEVIGRAQVVVERNNIARTKPRPDDSQGVGIVAGPSRILMSDNTIEDNAGCGVWAHEEARITGGRNRLAANRGGDLCGKAPQALMIRTRMLAVSEYRIVLLRDGMELRLDGLQDPKNATGVVVTVVLLRDGREETLVFVTDVVGGRSEDSVRLGGLFERVSVVRVKVEY